MVLEMKTVSLEQEIYTVSQLNGEARLLLEEVFKTMWITGEISNLSRPSSGHLYFSLKDEFAQVRCAFFRNSHRSMQFTPENGQQVLLQAQVSLYEPRGDYQLIVKHLQLAGDGALQLAFEQLKKKLAQEGLFDEAHKKPIPTHPKCIGVITSATGAAVRDILIVLRRRAPSIPVIIYPSLVQGDQAAKQLVEAIKIANQRQECDVLILARGGGSLEDLWPFNDEALARTIFASKIPIVSGVGHEVDFTIADFVADLRAPTPSAAAEHVSPNQLEIVTQLNRLYAQLYKSIQYCLTHYKNQLHHLQKRLRHPGQRLRESAQHLDQLEQRLWQAIQTQLKTSQHKLLQLSRTLDALSPLQTLQRGYSILQLKETGKIIRDANTLSVGDQVFARLAKGELVCHIEKIIK